jgi:hypothetical protein
MALYAEQDGKISPSGNDAQVDNERAMAGLDIGPRPLTYAFFGR